MESESKSDQDGEPKDKKDDDEDMSLDQALLYSSCLKGSVIYSSFSMLLQSVSVDCDKMF